MSLNGYVYPRLTGFLVSLLLCYVLQLTGAPSLPTYFLDCAGSTGGTLTGEPIVLKKMKSEIFLTATIDVQVVKLYRSSDFPPKFVGHSLY